MNISNKCHIRASLSLCIFLAGWMNMQNQAVAQQTPVFQLTQIDSGVSRVSSYWGYNAPKLVYDGETFYSPGYWGESPSTSQLRVYKRHGDRWVSGFTATDADYQPGMLLLDSQKRLILIYGRQNAGPRILRSDSPGDIDHFSPLPVPAAINRAGYIGAGIYDERLVLGYIGDPASYSFNMAVLDLRSQTWTGPVLLAPAQRAAEPYTTWLYPLIIPDKNGIHLTVSNNADQSSYYNQILYLHVSYDLRRISTPESVAEVNPWTKKLAFGQNMWMAQDGSLYVTGMHQPEVPVNANVYRRDPHTGKWSAHTIGPSQVMAVFQSPDEPGRLWLTSAHGPEIRLYTSPDSSRTWNQVSLPNFPPLVSTFFLHGINPASGSVMPEGPCAVFSSGPHPHYQTWMIEFHTSGDGKKDR